MMTNSSKGVKDNDELKQWIYLMFFSTKSGPDRIQITSSVNTEPKKIHTIANDTKMSYYRVKYNVNILEQGGFLIKTKSGYDLSAKFKENYELLTDITNRKFKAD